MIGNELLRGEHVYLAPTTKEALEELFPLLSSLSYGRWAHIGIAHPGTSIEKIWEWVKSEREKGRAYNFMIRLLADDKAIGVCNAKDINWHSRWCEIGIGIADESLRGRGYGTDAMRVLLRYIFMELNLHRAALGVSSFNEAAIASYKKAGFKHEVTHREAVYRDLHYYDIYEMGILFHEWQAMQQAGVINEE